jgi:large subunit ribosomal protein L4
MQTEVFLNDFKLRKNTIGLIHRVYLNSLKNQRKYLASTKTKSEVRGGGKKPWRQKGTGRARAGSSRSPLWVGGGVIFGPKPRFVNKKTNKKEKKLAILSSLFLKRKLITFVEDKFLEEISLTKTKNFLNILKTLNFQKSEKILFILNHPNKLLWLVSRNLKNIILTTANTLNLFTLLKTKHIVLSKETLQTINLIYGK